MSVQDRVSGKIKECLLKERANGVSLWSMIAKSDPTSSDEGPLSIGGVCGSLASELIDHFGVTPEQSIDEPKKKAAKAKKGDD